MQNNAISKVLNKLQVFNFRCTVHTNTTPTVHDYTHVRVTSGVARVSGARGQI